MTVCIAASCLHEGAPRIILCADWKTQSALGSAETAQKTHKLKEGWFALGAGSASQIEALAREYRAHFRTIEEITDVNIGEAMTTPLRNRKRHLVEEYTRSKYAIPYDEFLAHGKERFPPETFRQELEAIKRIDLGARLIIAGFTMIGFADKRRDEKTASPNICKTDRYGSMSLEEDWAVIGEGEMLASPSLLRRECNSGSPITEAVYYVAEAKVAAQNLPSIGLATSINVLSPGGRLTGLSEAGYARFFRLVKKYRPDLKAKDFQFDAAIFEAALPTPICGGGLPHV